MIEGEIAEADPKAVVSDAVEAAPVAAPKSANLPVSPVSQAAPPKKTSKSNKLLDSQPKKRPKAKKRRKVNDDLEESLPKSGKKSSTGSAATKAEPAAKTDVDLRADLAAALEGKRKADDSLSKHKGAIERLQGEISASADRIENLKKAVERAQTEYAQVIVQAAASGEKLPVGRVQAARLAVPDQEDKHDALKQARVTLEADLPGWQREAADAAVEVETAISSILALHALQMLGRAQELAKQMIPVQSALSALWADREALSWKGTDQ